MLKLAYNKIEKAVFTFLEPIAAANQVDVWDIEYKKEGPDYVLRVYLDKDEGISLDDCERVSRALEAVLDEQDPIPQAYLLEVSSAGLDRAIKYERHFHKCMGQDVDVKLFAPVDGIKEFTATLHGFDGESVTFLENGKERIFSLDKISSIRLSVVL